MKKMITAALAALMLICLFVGCGEKQSFASPASLVVPEQHTPKVGQNTAAAASEDRKVLCGITWLDTDSFDEYTLSEDGSFAVLREKTQKTENGEWELRKDESGSLSLWLRYGTGREITLYELEYYETSVFAVDETGEAYIWLEQDE